MTSKERLLCALRHGVPDRVPVAPDLTMLLPARLSGKPFWELLFQQAPPIWHEIVRLRERLGFDAMIQVGQDESEREKARKRVEVLKESAETIEARQVFETPHGRLTRTTVYPREDAPWAGEPLVKAPVEDLPKLLDLYDDPGGRSGESLRAAREMLSNGGIVGDYIGVPSFNWCLQRGSIQDAILDYYDEPALMGRYTDAYTEYGLAYIENSLLKLKPDYFMFGGSYASMSVISPAFYREHNLAFVQRACALLKSRGVPACLHMCGRSNEMVAVFARETDLDMLEPLERPPSGNVDLAAVKQAHGSRLCLKGNIHTFLTLLGGTPETVQEECRARIADAGGSGGFILASGDQVPRDTPLENLQAMIETARTSGLYPLN